MGVSSESAEQSWADNRRKRLFTSYLPVALAAAGCAAAIAIVLMGQDLTSQRSAWEHDKLVREQLKEESSTIDPKLADRRHELGDLEARLKDLRQNASTAQSGLDKALADKGKTDAERLATQTQLDSLHQQLDEGQKKLSGIKDDLTRNGDQQAKLQPLVQQLSGDQVRLQAVTKQLDIAIKSMTQQRDTLETEVEGARTQFRQLKQDAAGQQAEAERLKKQSEDLRKEVGELNKQWTPLTAQVQDLQGKAAKLKPLADQCDQLERNVTELRGKIADLDPQRQALEQTVKSLQQQKDLAAKDLKTTRDDIDATTTELARIREQLKGLDGGRRELLALQAQREDLERRIDQLRNSLALLSKPVPSSDPTPTPSPAPDQPPRPGR